MAQQNSLIRRLIVSFYNGLVSVQFPHLCLMDDEQFRWLVDFSVSKPPMETVLEVRHSSTIYNHVHHVNSAIKYYCDCYIAISGYIGVELSSFDWICISLSRDQPVCPSVRPVKRTKQRKGNHLANRLRHLLCPPSPAEQEQGSRKSRRTRRRTRSCHAKSDQNFQAPASKQTPVRTTSLLPLPTFQHARTHARTHAQANNQISNQTDRITQLAAP